MTFISNCGTALRALPPGATPAIRAITPGLVLLVVVGMAFAVSRVAEPHDPAIFPGISGRNGLDTLARSAAPEFERWWQQHETQGELSRTLLKMDPVQAVAVSLILPHAASSPGPGMPPTASVILTLKPGQKLTTQQIQAVTNLIAQAVPSLTAQNVTLICRSGVPL